MTSDGTVEMPEGSRDPVAEFRLYTAAMFPGGFQCPSCHRVLTEGQPFAERAVGMSGEALVTLLTCVYCVGGG